MKKVIVLILIFLQLLILPSIKVYADSQRAYQDYLYQFDVYRRAYNEFEVAKNEYEKFDTLNSQAVALEKTIEMLRAREAMLRSYLLLLQAKIAENNGLSEPDKQLYRTLIDREIVFLDSHIELIKSTTSIEDAKFTSKELENHYRILQASMYQTVIGLSLGELTVYGKKFANAINLTQDLLQDNRGKLDIPKQTTVDRWMVSILNKQKLYQEKVTNVYQTNTALKSAKREKLDIQFAEMQKNLDQAKTYLTEGTSNIQELVNELRYDD